MLKIYHIEGPLDCPNWPKKVDESCLLALQSEVSQLDFHVVWGGCGGTMLERGTTDPLGFLLDTSEPP